MAKAIKRYEIGSELPEVCELPNLIGIQTESFSKFLQLDKVLNGEAPDPNYGLEYIFQNNFPIISANGDMRVDYVGYSVDMKGIKLSEMECKKKGKTYGVPVKATVTLETTKTGEIKEKDIFFGEFPLMTERGTFIINGAERVIVSQIVRSPGIIFAANNNVSGISGSKDESFLFYHGIFYPYSGTKLEFKLVKGNKQAPTSQSRVKANNIISVGFGKKFFLFTFFLRMLGMDTRDKIVSSFYESRELDLSEADADRVYFSYKDIYDESGKLITVAGAEIRPAELLEQGISTALVVDTEVDSLEDPELAVLKTLGQEKEFFDKRMTQYWRDESSEEFQNEYINSVVEACKSVLPQNLKTFPAPDKIINYFRDFFLNGRGFVLSEVGRHKLNKKFYGMDESKYKDSPYLLVEDVVNVVKKLMIFSKGSGRGKEEEIKDDDIDALSNRRVRTVEELLRNNMMDAFSRMAKAARDKMAVSDETAKPQEIISIKPIVGAVKEFFGSSQLSQFMDQVNPLAELTHKRRITALGPKGGLSRSSLRTISGVRDVHYTHYGRICPIETPEGSNIGLILSLANYAKINEHGFIETPYRKVVNGKLTNEVQYLDANDEEKCCIAQGNAKIGPDGSFLEKEVSVRRYGEYEMATPDNIEYMDVSPKQVVSVAASLIPFLEHDDANRALMGSNMQRQAVPLVFPEAPRVGTGMERSAAYDAGVLIKAKRAGTVRYVSSTKIVVEPSDSDIDGDIDEYLVHKVERTNQDSCLNQKPIVNVGDVVEAGDVLADGPSTQNGELALGRNILVGFVPWNGYNYEDAVLISERVVREDIYTSVHIKEFVIDVKETKLGPERLTRDIPNTSEKLLEHLDSEGIVCVGTYVRPGDILVGKVTPKSESDTTPEVKLLNSIFGEKAKEVRDNSLKVPHGTEGTVIDITRLLRSEGEELPQGVDQTVKVLIATKRKLKQGDKMAGRHGNKGVVSRVLPEEDMPYMEDGTPLDVCLNPLGVPSRMNIGQLMETELGWAAVKNDKWYKTPVFQSASMEQIEAEMAAAGLPLDSKTTLYDGRTGLPFVNKVFCGYIYYLKLHHLVDDKMHARSTGPYSLVTQQPLGGKAMFGGQRLGEMEVWAFEAYGAANTLQELLTIKSDDMKGRVQIYESIVKGEASESVSMPEAFNVLVQEIRGLGLDISVYDEKGRQVPLTERDEKLISDREKGER